MASIIPVRLLIVHKYPFYMKRRQKKYFHFRDSSHRIWNTVIVELVPRGSPLNEWLVGYLLWWLYWSRKHTFSFYTDISRVRFLFRVYHCVYLWPSYLILQNPRIQAGIKATLIGVPKAPAALRHYSDRKGLIEDTRMNASATDLRSVFCIDPQRTNLPHYFTDFFSWL